MLQKMASIDAQMRLLVPKRVSDDDKLIEYDALLLDRFLDILEELHGKELKDTVIDRIPGCYSRICSGNSVSWERYCSPGAGLLETVSLNCESSLVYVDWVVFIGLLCVSYHLGAWIVFVAKYVRPLVK